jgi:hypothetical protein
MDSRTKSLPCFTKVTWEDVREEVMNVNPELANIIDQISPNKKYFLIKASYCFGDLIVKDGITQFPIADDNLLPASDKRIQSLINDSLSYSPIPLFLILKNACEVFIESPLRTVPLNLFYPGSLLGLFESIDFMFKRESSVKWCVSSGARNLFMLPKINEASGLKKLKTAYDLNSNIQVRGLADHWRLFYEIFRHKSFEGSWRNDVLFFTKDWMLNKNSDKGWFAFKDYLFKNAWHQAQFAISKVGLSLTWEHFAKAIAARRLKPIPYLADQVKHIMLIAAGRWPGFKATDDSQQVAPTLALQKAIVDIYGLKKYFPSIMHIASLENENQLPGYYSLSYPTLIEGSPDNTASSTIMLDLRDIKQLVDTIRPVFQNIETEGNRVFSDVSFDYFHVEKDKYHEIKLSKDILPLDKMLLSGKIQFPEREFCTTSQFWRGCIRISKK